MSWVKNIPDIGDDIFDEDDDGMNIESKEWKSNMEKRIKEGYRDGVDAGKEAARQRGFNAGYRKGAANMVVIGQLKGIVSAIHCWCHQKQMDMLSVTQLLQDVVKHEEMMIERIKTAELHPPATLDDITDRIEDLGTQIEGANCASNNCCMGEVREQEASVSTSQTHWHSTPCHVPSTEDCLEQLIKSCLKLVSELGFPEEISHHLKQMMTH